MVEPCDHLETLCGRAGTLPALRTGDCESAVTMLLTPIHAQSQQHINKTRQEAPTQTITQHTCTTASTRAVLLGRHMGQVPVQVPVNT